MKIRLLGTGYGECKVKKFASKDFRRSGGVIVDSEILLDIPADIFEAADELGFSDLLDKIEAVFISHSHKGHFDVEALLKLASTRRISVFADKELLSLIPDLNNIEKIPAAPFKPIEFKNYKILPLPTNHATDIKKEICLNYVISKDKCLLYALDGGLLNMRAWQVLRQLKINAVIMDTAEELTEPTERMTFHGGYATNLIIKKIFTSAGVTNEKSRFVLSHIPSPKKRSVHEELSQIAAADGFAVAYDGYFLNL